MACRRVDQKCSSRLQITAQVKLVATIFLGCTLSLMVYAQQPQQPISADQILTSFVNLQETSNSRQEPVSTYQPPTNTQPISKPQLNYEQTNNQLKHAQQQAQSNAKKGLLAAEAKFDVGKHAPANPILDDLLESLHGRRYSTLKSTSSHDKVNSQTVDLNSNIDFYNDNTGQTIASPASLRNNNSVSPAVDIARPKQAPSDNVLEGSGVGPLPPKSHAEKFDDTEEGDDDEEDYDYKDTLESGSGFSSNDSIPGAKLAEVVKSPSTSATEIDPFNPFRKPSSTSVSTTTQKLVITTPVTTVRLDSTTYQPLKLPNSSVSVQSRVPVEGISIPDSASHKQLQTPTQPAILVGPYAQPALPNDHKNLSEGHGLRPIMRPTVGSMYDSSTTRPPLRLLETEVKLHSIRPLVSNPRSKSRHDDASTNLSVSRSNKSSSLDVDYDYEEEQDEDSEDSSNFEDNDTPPDKDLNTKKASTVSSQNIILPKLTTNVTKPFFNNTNFATITPSYSSIVEGPRLNKTHHYLNSGGNQPEDEEDEDEDEDHEEELEDDIEEEEDEEEEAGYPNPVAPSPSIHNTPMYTLEPSITSSPPIETFDKNQKTQTTMRPSKVDFKPSTRAPVTLNESLSSMRIPTIISPNDLTTLPTLISEKPLSTVSTFWSTTTTRKPTTTSMITSTSAPAQRSTTTLPPSATLDSLNSFPSYSTTFSATHNSLSTRPTLTSVKPQVVPQFYPYDPILVHYASTTPKSRHGTMQVTNHPPVLTNTGKILPYEDDTDFTRQIYHKAVELYHSTNKAIQSTIETIWPSNFELSSSTFEPLLEKPFLFMLVLGAVIMGLVLTMMLLVYLISYQIKPAEDDSINTDISYRYN